MGWFSDITGFGESNNDPKKSTPKTGGGFLWELTGFGAPPGGKGASEAKSGWFSSNKEDNTGITGFKKPKTKRGAERMIKEGERRSAITGFKISDASEDHQANSLRHESVVRKQKNSWWK